MRDLIDSLYKGYPAGYLIISLSPDMRLKDGTLSPGKKIMIDGQQRVTAMMTAIAGKEIIDKEFKKSESLSLLILLQTKNPMERFSRYKMER